MPAFVGQSSIFVSAVGVACRIPGVEQSIHSLPARPITGLAQRSLSVVRLLLILPFSAEATAHARSSAGAATVTLVMSRQGVAASEASITSRADMRSLPRVELVVSFEVVQSPEAERAR